MSVHINASLHKYVCICFLCVHICMPVFLCIFP